MIVSRRRLHLLSSVTPDSQKLRLPPHQHQTYTQRVCIILYSHTFKQFTHHAQSACFGITDLPSPFESIEFAMKPYTSALACAHAHTHTHFYLFPGSQQGSAVGKYVHFYNSPVQLQCHRCSRETILTSQNASLTETHAYKNRVITKIPK